MHNNKNYYDNDQEINSSEHSGFHFFCKDRQGIFYGNPIIRNDRVIGTNCSEVALNAVLDIYMLIKNDQEIPYCHYRIFGKEGYCPASEFYLHLKGSGIPLSNGMIQALTNRIVEKSVFQGAYDEPGYVLVDDQRRKSEFRKAVMEKMPDIGEEDLEEIVKEQVDRLPLAFKQFKVVSLRETQRKFSGNVPREKTLDMVVQDLRDLYDLTDDKRAFIVAFSYSLMSPFSSVVRKRRYFFPNLIFLGLPETGKNSLLNLFLARMWDMEDNIKTTGDFDKDFAIMKNLEGTGLPIVINDLDQEAFDRMRKYFMEGSMNPKGGSRGRPTLELQEYESLRGIAISSNFLAIGATEATSRFIIHSMQTTDNSKASEWNAVAEKLRGAMYPIARYFIDYLQKSMDPQTFVDYFHENRSSVKNTILQFGGAVLQDLFRRNDSGFSLDRKLMEYDEYEEDYLSIFIGWTQLALRKMQKEVNYYERDFESHEVITVNYRDSFYIQEKDDALIVFPMAWKDFLSKYRDFPFKSMEAFAKAYPEHVKSQPRKFKSADEDSRKGYRVLIIAKTGEPVEDVLLTEMAKGGA